VRKADNLPPSCAVVTKSGSFNFLEPSGPLQACNGTALYSVPSSAEKGYANVNNECKYLLSNAFVSNST